MPSKFLESLGIASAFDAIELERVLGISFKEFTPQHCDVWRNQTVYLYQYALTHAVSKAARMAGVTIYTAQRWQTDNILGFNRRMEVALLEFTDEVEVMLLEHVREPESSPMLLAMLLRAQMPEKYGPARRSSAPRNHDCDHDPQPTTSHDDQTSLADLRRELEDLKRQTAVGERHPTPQPDISNLSPTPDDYVLTEDAVPATNDLQSTPVDPTPVGAGFKPAHDLSPADGGPSYPDLSPTERETSHPDLSPADGETSLPDLSPADGETSLPDLSPAGGETQRGGTPQHPEPSTRNLSRRQRRELQRQAKRKHQKSRRARAPN